jgi:sulfur carrier protein ThiS
MKIFIERNNKWLNLKFNGNVKALLQQLKINPESVLVIRNNKLLTEADKLRNNDEVKILSVISGG